MDSAASPGHGFSAAPLRSAADPALRVEALTKRYGETRVLDDVSFSLPAGTITLLTGRSGSGKTTLFKMLGGLDRPTSGSIVVEGVDMATLDEEKLADLRLRRLGIVFQSFNLLPDLTATENVRLPLDLAGVKRKDADARATELLALVGLTHRATSRPNVLSGGEQQRVAVARALVNKPAILLADEPTGNLDRANAERVFSLLEEVNARLGTTILIVSHDDDAIDRFARRLTLDDGRLRADAATAPRPRA